MDDNRQFDQDWNNISEKQSVQKDRFSKFKFKKKARSEKRVKADEVNKTDKIGKINDSKKKKRKSAFRSKGKKAQTGGSRVMEYKVQKGNLSQTVEGTGTLENADSTDLKIPTGLKIKKIKVSEGDEVKKGDTLATVDQTSLLAALAETQSDFDDINSQLERV